MFSAGAGGFCCSSNGQGHGTFIATQFYSSVCVGLVLTIVCILSFCSRHHNERKLGLSEMENCDDDDDGIRRAADLLHSVHRSWYVFVL